MKTYIFTIQLSSGATAEIDIAAKSWKEACCKIKGEVIAMKRLPGRVLGHEYS